MTVQILEGDCRELLKTLPDESIDSIVTDPPYELGFMGKKWDASGIAYDIRVWRECLRVLKPGGHLLAFGGTRTYHRMTCAIEDAGFEIRDCIMWVYGSGFPKSHDVSKAIDKAAGAEREVVGIDHEWIRRVGQNHGKSSTYTDKCHGSVGPNGGKITAPATDAARQWSGWGTALKPAWEPVIVARKPLCGTVAENVLRHGTGGINVDGCRVGWASARDAAAAAVGFANSRAQGTAKQSVSIGRESRDGTETYHPDKLLGRWPANVIHDGSDEVVGLFPETTSGSRKAGRHVVAGGQGRYGKFAEGELPEIVGDSGTAARFFYCAKTSSAERGEDNRHPTVKPLALMRYLCRLVTPPKGTVLDPFAGSGTTLVAAKAEGFCAVGCELMPEHIEIIKGRLDMPIEAEQAQVEQARQEAPKTTKPTQLKLLLG